MDRKSNLGSWIIITFFGFASLFIIAVAWWWWFFETPTSPPSNVKSFYMGSESNDKFIFGFAWENGDVWPVSYNYILKDDSKKIISSGTTTETSWNSPGLENGTYTFTINASALTWFSSKRQSGNITIEVVVNNPNTGSDQEVFVVIGNNSSGTQHEYFSTSQNAEKVCEAIGAQLATDVQMIEAFNDGADWWMYSWFKNTLGSEEVEGGYPCWYNSQACSDKAQIIYGGSTLAGVACWGNKPPQNQKLNIPSKLIDNPKASTISSFLFSACQGRYYQRDLSSENLCSCDINSCSS